MKLEVYDYQEICEVCELCMLMHNMIIFFAFQRTFRVFYNKLFRSPSDQAVVLQLSFTLR